MRAGEVVAAIALVSCLCSPSAGAQTADEDRADNAQAEASVCLSYFYLVSECGATDEEARLSSEKGIARLNKVSTKLSGAAKMGPEEEKLRLSLNTMKQRTLMGESCRGIGLLRARYADQCGELLEKNR